MRKRSMPTSPNPSARTVTEASSLDFDDGIIWCCGTKWRTPRMYERTVSRYYTPTIWVHTMEPAYHEIHSRRPPQAGRYAGKIFLRVEHHSCRIDDYQPVDAASVHALRPA